MAKLNWQKLAQDQKLDKSRELYGPNFYQPTFKEYKKKPEISRSIRNKALALIKANKGK